MNKVTEIKVPEILFDAGCTNCGSCGGPKITIAELSVVPGMHVKRDQVLIVLETNKAVFDVRSPCDGQVLELFFAEGDLVEERQVFLSLAESIT